MELRGEELVSVQLICDRIYCLVDGFRVELERVCDEFPEDDDDE